MKKIWYQPKHATYPQVHHYYQINREITKRLREVVYRSHHCALSLQMRNRHMARVPSVCAVRTRVAPTLTHRIGCSLACLPCFKSLKGGVALVLKFISVSIGGKDFSILPEVDQTLTLPSMLPVTRVVGAYSCKCMLAMTLLSTPSCHKIACFLDNIQDLMSTPPCHWKQKKSQSLTLLKENEGNWTLKVKMSEIKQTPPTPTIMNRMTDDLFHKHINWDPTCLILLLWKSQLGVHSPRIQWVQLKF